MSATRFLFAALSGLLALSASSAFAQSAVAAGSEIPEPGLGSIFLLAAAGLLLGRSRKPPK